MESKSILAVTPTYNEAKNIAVFLEKIFSLAVPLSVLVIDDNSPDNTGGLVAELRQKYPNLYLIERKCKMGLGSAYIEGFRYALKQNYAVIIQIDADISHLPCYIPGMLKMLKNYDLVIGSRYVKGGGACGWPLKRAWLSRSANIFVRMALGVPFNDLTSGFKCIRRPVLERMDFDNITAKGYAFQIEAVYKAFLKNAAIGEYPIVFRGRQKEASKMSPAIVIEAFFKVAWLALKRFVDVLRRRST